MKIELYPFNILTNEHKDHKNKIVLLDSFFDEVFTKDEMTNEGRLTAKGITQNYLFRNIETLSPEHIKFCEEFIGIEDAVDTK